MDASESTLSKVAYAPIALARQYERKLGSRWYRWHFDRMAEHDAVDDRLATDAVHGADRVTFLCLGNICRSPFAEAYARQHLTTSDVDISISSAGLSPYEGIQSPEQAIATAAEFGIDLSAHRSEKASAEVLNQSDVIFVMDFVNYYLLRTRHSGVIEKTYFLGPLADEESVVTIPDPHRQTRSHFRESYTTIAAAIDRLWGSNG